MKHRPADGLQAEMVAHKGCVPDSILAFAQDQHADLIVMRTHGRRDLDRLVMGSVTEHILRKAPCPVLAVRKASHGFVCHEGENGYALRLERIRKFLRGLDGGVFAGAVNQALRVAIHRAIPFCRRGMMVQAGY